MEIDMNKNIFVRLAGRLLMLGAITVLLTGAVASPVGAQDGGPIIFRDHLDDTFTTGYCGFPMKVDTTGTGVFHLFLDENGDFERIIITSANIKLSFTNLDTGETVWTPSVNMVEAQLNADGTGTQTLRGLLWHLIVPDEGLLTADVGRIDFLLTFDENGNIISADVVFAAGQQEGEFLSMLCTVLAPGP